MGVDDVRLVDNHCHGVVKGELDRARFESLISESFHPPPEGTSTFEAPLGLAVRRWCAPVLGLDPFPEPDAYLARRSELGADEVSRRFLREAGVGELLVDTGYRSDELAGLDDMRELSGVPCYEVVRLEAVAESVAATAGLDAAGYADAFRAELASRCRSAVGLKTIVAYRGGFAFDPEPPDDAAVTQAAGAFLAGAEHGRTRLEDPVLLRFGIWEGARIGLERGLPIQFHVGWGDPDLDLHLTNPSLLTPLYRRFLDAGGVNVVLLHCYPFHRVAGYLATMFPNVYFDVGSALHYHGPSARTLLAEAMEVAPFAKLLYSSDAFGLPEQYHLGALLFRRALASILDAWVAAGECDGATADRIAVGFGHDNALRIYRAPSSG